MELNRMEIPSQASDNRIRNPPSRRSSKHLEIMETTIITTAMGTRTTTEGAITQAAGIQRITTTIRTPRIDVVARIRTHPDIRITDSILTDSIEKMKNIRNLNHRIRMRNLRRVQIIIIIIMLPRYLPHLRQ